MNDLAEIKQTFCRIYGDHLASCQLQHSWLEWMSQDRVVTMLTALVGTLIGGFITYFIQTRLKKRDAERSLQGKVAVNVVKLVMMKADLDNLDRAFRREIEEHDKDIKAGAKLWQIIYKFDFEPSLRRLDNDDVAEMVKLRSRRLVQSLLELSSEYSGVIRRVDQYHSLKDEYEERIKGITYFKDGQRYFKDSNDPHKLTLETRMEILLQFLNAQLPQVSKLAEELQRLLGEVSKRHFGTLDFLKLQDEDNRSRVENRS